MAGEQPGLRDRTGSWTDWSLELAEKVEARFRALAQVPFRGIATSEGVRAGLFPLQRTGADVGAPRRAALAYIAALTLREEGTGRFPLAHESWRQWINGARYFLRHGLCLEDLSDAKRELALAVMHASLSDDGFQQVLDMMHLNRTIGEIRNELDILNEWLYWFSVYGAPEKPDEPWGWQLDGHHVCINCMFVGDQMVLTPTFLGAEPVFADGGRYAGTRVFAAEEATGQELFISLAAEQRRQATIASEMPRDLFTGAYRDNFELNYEGIPLRGLGGRQREIVHRLIGLFVNRARSGSAQAKLKEFEAHTDETHFAWIGDGSEHGVFYYRVHSPVILVEFEHVPGQMFDNDYPTRNHIHTVVRTPNGNDYGADLLRQHHERHDHEPGQHHHHAHPGAGKAVDLRQPVEVVHRPGPPHR